MNHNRSTALERSVINYLGGGGCLIKFVSKIINGKGNIFIIYVIFSMIVLDYPRRQWYFYAASTSQEVSETVRTGRNIDLSAVLSETRAILDRYFFFIIIYLFIYFFYKRNNNKKDISNWTYFPMLTGLFQVCAKQKCSSVSFRIGLTLFLQYTYQNTCDSFFLSKLNVF